MVVIARISFPRRHLNQAVAAYTGLPPLPPGIVKSGPFLQAGGDTVQVLAIYDIRPEAMEDVFSELRERYRCFAAIPDFVCDIQAWREFRELLASWVE